jgi:hypothetical protein
MIRCLFQFDLLFFMIPDEFWEATLLLLLTVMLLLDLLTLLLVFMQPAAPLLLAKPPPHEDKEDVSFILSSSLFSSAHVSRTVYHQVMLNREMVEIANPCQDAPRIEHKNSKHQAL